MTNSLVVIINSLKVPKIKKILLYEMKFLVPNYSCLQIRGLPPPDPRSLRPQLNLLNPPEKTFLGTPLIVVEVRNLKQNKRRTKIFTDKWACHLWQVGLLMVLLRSGDSHYFQTVSVFVGELLVPQSVTGQDTYTRGTHMLSQSLRSMYRALTASRRNKLV